MENPKRKQHKSRLKRDCQTDTHRKCLTAGKKESLGVGGWVWKRDMYDSWHTFSHQIFRGLRWLRMVKQVKFIITSLLFVSSTKINSIDTQAQIHRWWEWVNGVKQRAYTHATQHSHILWKDYKSDKLDWNVLFASCLDHDSNRKEHSLLNFSLNVTDLWHFGLNSVGNLLSTVCKWRKHSCWRLFPFRA